YMLFDGMHAFARGEYFLPSPTGQPVHLGPWASIPHAIGLDPHSVVIKTMFVAFGLAWIGAGSMLLVRPGSLRLARTLLSVANLWYFPVGTAISIIHLIELRFESRVSLI
ncbi:MAG: hypothetical protein M3N19_05830, partial [Candidatus Eremiobacteraeota bacterium]|nr:hypothetical protein [Candidatus Eremiobacteraeota bacterium]